MIARWLDTASPYAIEDSDATGFTTNPLLVRSLNWHIHSEPERDYLIWERDVLQAAAGRPISIEVTATTLAEMETQAERILALGPNVLVKIPIQTPQGLPTAGLIRNLERVNATCCFTRAHMTQAVDAGAAICSVFAGRIADTGLDPAGLFGIWTKVHLPTRFLWASTREVYNIVQAEKAGADIITLSPELYEKANRMLGRDVAEYGLETVKEFCQ